jgi:methylmalonyl-CoA mutase N-terminal domain/subunit
MSRRRERFRTTSGIEIDRLYGPEGTSADYMPDLGEPGRCPFTRGIYEETNDRFHYLLESGQTGLSVAFDLPTQMGLDSSDARAEGEVGRVGVAIDTVDDMGRLFEGIPLELVSTSMTINATAAILLAMYVAVADAQGVERELLAGTVQNDMLKEFIARGTYIYPVEPSLRLVTDIFAFCARELPRWNSISISGYHMREAGATAAQEIAFTLANAREYIRRALERGLELEDFAPRLSFFFAAHNNLFEEVAKFRAARRLWARMMREEFHASERACRLRFHTQTGGSTLTAQQPLNNVVRVTVQALAAVLGGTQSLHTNSHDEALSLPDAGAARLALRTQQVLAMESGVADTVDPLGGSYYVEHLTSRLGAMAADYIGRLEELGAQSSAIRFMDEEIQAAAYAHQIALERGETEVVGVNVYAEGDHEPELPAPDFAGLQRLQRRRLAEVLSRRDSNGVRQALNAVEDAASSGANLLPPIIEAVKARATLGEISATLEDLWGRYKA